MLLRHAGNLEYYEICKFALIGLVFTGYSSQKKTNLKIKKR
jgi:hypothetical protein